MGIPEKRKVLTCSRSAESFLNIGNHRSGGIIELGFEPMFGSGEGAGEGSHHDAQEARIGSCDEVDIAVGSGGDAGALDGFGRFVEFCERFIDEFPDYFGCHGFSIKELRGI